MHPYRGEYKSDLAKKVREMAGTSAKHEFPADRGERISDTAISKHQDPPKGDTKGDLGSCDRVTDAGYKGPYAGKIDSGGTEDRKDG